METTRLVLTRRLGESLIIGEDIRLTVVRIHGGQVQLAIEAPRETMIVREELLERGETR